MILAERSRIYPICIFVGLSVLVWSYWDGNEDPQEHNLTPEDEIDSKVINDLEAPPHDRFWIGLVAVQCTSS